jgi:hypothetical protein
MARHRGVEYAFTDLGRTLQPRKRRDGFVMEDGSGIAGRRNRSITDSIIFAPTAHSHEIGSETPVHVDQLSIVIPYH